MHFSEDDLRTALKRKEPGEGFTQRVMARVNQAQAEGAKQQAKAVLALPPWWMRRPAWMAAVAAALLFAFAWGGYQYSEYRHKEDQQRLQEAEKARDQAIRALEIARSKLNHVLERAQLPVQGVPVESKDKIRRQRL